MEYVKQEPAEAADDQDLVVEKDEDENENCSLNFPVDLTLANPGLFGQEKPRMVVDPLHDDVLFLHPPARPAPSRSHGRREVTEYETYSIAHHEAELNSKQLPKKYRCGFCVYKTSYKSDLNRHLKKHGIAPQHCPLCNMPFKTAGNLENHIRITHGIHSQTHMPELTSSPSPTLSAEEGGACCQNGLGSPPVLPAGGGVSLGPQLVLGAVAFSGRGSHHMQVAEVTLSPAERTGRQFGTLQGQDYPTLSQAVLSCHVCPFICNDSTVLASHILSHPAEEETSRATAAQKASSFSRDVPVTRLSCSSCGIFKDTSEELEIHRRSCVRRSTSLLDKKPSRCGAIVYSSEELQAHKHSCQQSCVGENKNLPDSARSCDKSAVRSSECRKRRISLAADQSEDSIERFLHKIERSASGYPLNTGNINPNKLNTDHDGVNKVARHDTLNKLRKSITGQNEADCSEPKLVSANMPLSETETSSTDTGRKFSHGSDKSVQSATPYVKTNSFSLSREYSTDHLTTILPSSRLHHTLFECHDLSQGKVSSVEANLAPVTSGHGNKDREGGYSILITDTRRSENGDKIVLMSKECGITEIEQKSVEQTSSSSKTKSNLTSDKVNFSSERTEKTNDKINYIIDLTPESLNMKKRFCLSLEHPRLREHPRPREESQTRGKFLTKGTERPDTVVMAEEDDVVIKEEPASPVATLEEDGEGNSCDLLPITTRQVSGAEYQNSPENDYYLSNSEACVLCDRVFVTRSALVKHMQQLHGLQLGRDAGRTNSSSRDFTKNTLDLNTVCCAHDACHTFRSSLKGHALPSQSERLIINQPQESSRHTYHQKQLQSTSKQASVANMSSYQTQSTLSSGSQVGILLNSRVTLQAPTSGRYAKLVSDFEEFAAQPYACSLCFYRTSELDDLRWHVENHLTGGSSRNRTSMTAQFCKARHDQSADRSCCPGRCLSPNQEDLNASEPLCSKNSEATHSPPNLDNENKMPKTNWKCAIQQPIYSSVTGPDSVNPDLQTEADTSKASPVDKEKFNSVEQSNHDALEQTSHKASDERHRKHSVMSEEGKIVGPNISACALNKSALDPRSDCPLRYTQDTFADDKVEMANERSSDISVAAKKSAGMTDSPDICKEAAAYTEMEVNAGTTSLTDLVQCKSPKGPSSSYCPFKESSPDTSENALYSSFAPVWAYPEKACSEVAKPSCAQTGHKGTPHILESSLALTKDTDTEAHVNCIYLTSTTGQQCSGDFTKIELLQKHATEQEEKMLTAVDSVTNNMPADLPGESKDFASLVNSRVKCTGANGWDKNAGKLSSCQLQSLASPPGCGSNSEVSATRYVHRVAKARHLGMHRLSCPAICQRQYVPAKGRNVRCVQYRKYRNIDACRLPISEIDSLAILNRPIKQIKDSPKTLAICHTSRKKKGVSATSTISCAKFCLHKALACVRAPDSARKRQYGKVFQQQSLSKPSAIIPPGGASESTRIAGLGIDLGPYAEQIS